MNKRLVFLWCTVLIYSCTTKKGFFDNKSEKSKLAYDFVVSFGSCNKQYEKQPLWTYIQKEDPDIFIWGGDIVYADTENMDTLALAYSTQLQNVDYKIFLEHINHEVYAVWDDHDYGINDGGREWPYKDKSQAVFLNFLDVDHNDPRRYRKGIYHSKNFQVNDKSIKLILLDTRYFRSPLQKNTSGKKRYTPWSNKQGTLLGEEQWQWLEEELKNSTADYHILVSSVQIWSDEHGYESWGNFPHEVRRLKKILNRHLPSNLIMLSGDRHISEFSQQKLHGYNYPIIDFTSSGLTHSYSNFVSEKNQDRIGNVISETSFGILKYHFKTNTLLLEMKNQKGVLQDYTIHF